MLVGEAWKKKIEEYFKNDIEGRNMSILESLNQNYKKNSNIVTHSGKAFSWKDQVINMSVLNYIFFKFQFDLLKNDIELVSKALNQINEKMQMTLALKEDPNRIYIFF